MSKITITNEDNMELMARYPDKYFDLAIVDPPYGIDVANDNRFGIKASKNSAAKTNDYAKKDWDKGLPTAIYWDELFRVSKNQIIWGVNYFTDNRLSGGRIFWHKNVPEDYTKSKGEIAFKSFGISVDYINVTWHGMLQYDMKNKEIRIHPTQKPIQLYKHLLKKYATPGDKILDTHLGSGSIAIACHDLGFDLVACELDKDYYEAAMKRLKLHQAQLTLELK